MSDNANDPDDTSAEPLTNVPDGQWDDVETLATQIAYRLANAPMRPWPFAHLEIEELLPDTLFQSVRSFDLADALVSRRSSMEAPPPRVNPARFFHPLIDAQGLPTVPESPAMTAAVLALSHRVVTQTLIGRFKPVVAQRFGGRIPLTSCSMEYLDDRCGYDLLPHTDVSQKLVTVLLYLADDDAEPNLGTILYSPRAGRILRFSGPTSRQYSADDMIEVHRVLYRPNRALVFAPTANSLHGVAKVASVSQTRRLIQYQINAVQKAPEQS